MKFPDKEILDLTKLSYIFPTGYHGASTSGVTSGSTVYVAGARPVGLAAAHSAQLPGVVVIVGDLIEERLAEARSFGCSPQLDHGSDPAAGRLGIPGLDVTGDPDAVDDAAKGGSLSISPRASVR